MYTVNRLQISMHVLIGSDAGVLGITLGQFWEPIGVCPAMSSDCPTPYKILSFQQRVYPSLLHHFFPPSFLVVLRAFHFIILPACLGAGGIYPRPSGLSFPLF